MIKTVSFAPPRAASSAKAKASSKSRASGSSNSEARARRATAPSPAVEAPVAPATISAAAARAALQKDATKSQISPAQNTAKNQPKSAKNSAPDQSSFKAPEKAAGAARADAKAVPVRASVSKAENGTPAPQPTAIPKAKRTIQTAKRVPQNSEVSAPSASAPSALKAKRSRVPKDLAQQYGAVSEEAPRVVAPIGEAPRKRLTRAERAARSQLVRPDDDVLQRLARAGEVARPMQKRGRGWEFECGFCGRTTRFQTPGALCECGAIAVRE